MNKTSLLAILGALLITGAVVAALVLGDSGDEGQPPLSAQSTALPTSTAPATPTATPAPQPSATPLADRTSCAEIQGTPYRSEAERAYYLASCTAPQTAAAAPDLSADTSPACATDVQVLTSRSDATFNVSGTTVEQINASLDANGPLVDGETAAGLTQYEYGIKGSFCARAGSCSLGVMTINADIVVTLPDLTTISALSPDLKALWDRFAEMVRVHENRHVTILEEGLAEMRRQLLLISAQPNCDSLDHEVDKVWLLYSSQMEQRQAAFHAADRTGQGGSVVR